MLVSTVPKCVCLLCKEFQGGKSTPLASGTYLILQQQFVQFSQGCQLGSNNPFQYFSQVFQKYNRSVASWQNIVILTCFLEYNCTSLLELFQIVSLIYTGLEQSGNYWYCNTKGFLYNQIQDTCNTQSFEQVQYFNSLFDIIDCNQFLYKRFQVFVSFLIRQIRF